MSKRVLKSLAIALFGAAPLLMAKSQGTQDPRRLWAYPKGVIVTSDQGRLTPVKRDEDNEAPASDPFPPALLKSLTKPLESCFSAVRDAHPEMAQHGAKFAFTIDFSVTPDGSVANAVLTKQSAEDLPDCGDAARAAVAAYKFKPRTDQRPRDGRAGFDAVILTDDEAQGRGYQFYAAETAWDEAQKHHKEWFGCRRDADCVVSGEMCDVRGVAAAYLDAYKKAINERRHPGCRAAADASAYKPVCKRLRCAAAKL